MILSRYKASVSIAWINYIEMLSYPKTWVGVFIGVVLCSLRVLGYFNFAHAIGSPVHIVEAYVIVGSTVSAFSGFILGAIFFLSDLPKKKNSYYFELVRVGQRKWIWGQLFYVVLSVLTYSVIILFAICLLSVIASHVLTENTWSLCMEKLAYDQPNFAIQKFQIAFPHDTFIEFVSPYAAMLKTFFFNSIYVITISFIALFINAWGRLNFGWFFAVLLHGVGYTIYMNGPFFVSQKLSLLSCAMPALHYTEMYNLSPMYSCLLFFSICGIVVLLLNDDRRELSS